jgi:O-acetylhomoserine/O-acetylserine sulfhydrylase-like pyridoxal-dependent enzyme
MAPITAWSGLRPSGNLAYIIRARTVLLRNTGAATTPFNAWLFLQGLETLHLRMERHSENAMKVATWLENNDKVAWVSYPGLDSSPYKEIADRVLHRQGLQRSDLLRNQERSRRWQEVHRVTEPVQPPGEYR